MLSLFLPLLFIIVHYSLCYYYYINSEFIIILTRKDRFDTASHARNITLNGLTTNPPLMHSLLIFFLQCFPLYLPLIPTLTNAPPTNEILQHGVLYEK